jgi:hypothetical protein
LGYTAVKIMIRLSETVALKEGKYHGEVNGAGGLIDGFAATMSAATMQPSSKALYKPL